MKAFVVAVVLASFVAIVTSEWTKEEKQIFRDWMKLYKKQYKSHEDEMLAMNKFMKDYKEIEQHNKEYAEGKHTYHRRVWEYSDLTKEERKKMLLGVQLNDDTRSTRDASQKTFPTGPKSVDWRKDGLVGPVRKQGGCGACWAFSVSAAVEGAIRKKNKNKAVMSEQQLIDCVTRTHGCKGGDPRYAMDYIRVNGQTDEEEYPYTGYQRSCEYSQDEKVATIKESNFIMTNGNETLMRDIVASVGLVSVVLCGAEDTFANYGGGVYNPPSCCTEINHAIAIIGYGTDPVGGDYWLVKNSWGTSWGDNGIGKMARNRDNLCNLTHWALWADAA